MFEEKSEIMNFLSSSCRQEEERIFRISSKLTCENKLEPVQFRGLLEISNICGRNCTYCGLRKDNKNIKRYSMGSDEIVAIANDLHSKGCNTILIQSGEISNFDVDDFCETVSLIKKQTNLCVALSLGEKEPEIYREFYKAGARRYLLKFETSNHDLYDSLHPDAVGTLNDRLQCLYQLKKIGFEIGTGNIIGFSDQTLDHVADDILLLRELNPDMVSLSPLIVHPDTPLGKSIVTPDFLLDYKFFKKLIATTRIILPTANITLSTAARIIFRNSLLGLIDGGINVLMNNVTPPALQELYEIYPKNCKHFENSFNDIVCRFLRKSRKSILEND